MNIGTNRRRASERKAVSIHVDWNQWLEILYLSIVVTQQLKYFAYLYFLLFSFETAKCLFVSSVQCKSDDWLINFPDVFEQKSFVS